jgi:hypothetical protein
MVRKLIAYPLLSFVITCGTLLAANPDVAPPSRAGTSVAQHAVASQPKLKTIYSNLGPKGKRYDCTNGWIVAGSNSALGHEQWIAMPFTPTANHTVTEIEIAVDGPANSPGFTLSLNADASGLPGTALHTWEIKKVAGGCPNLDTATYKQGIKVSKGKQYWVVAATDSTNEDAYDSWNYTYKDTTGPFAYDVGSGWTADNSYLSAFAVLGK